MRFISVAVALLLTVGPAVGAEAIVGRASVTDGDTIVIRGTRIRLHGIDAPESAQTCQNTVGRAYRCGQEAALALSDRIGASPIACEPRDTDRYGRTVAVCRTGFEDLNRWMVTQGHAVAYRRYSQDYVEAEAEAKAAARGIWAGTFQNPSEWRRERRAVGSDTRPAQGPKTTVSGGDKTACQIKGNINRKGDRIYHLPRSRDYDRTVISPSSGERMFCSEDEAKAAGWRPPRG